MYLKRIRWTIFKNTREISGQKSRHYCVLFTFVTLWQYPAGIQLFKVVIETP